MVITNAGHTHAASVFFYYLAVYEGDSVSVSRQLAHGLGSVLPQRPPVPHLAERVVAAREQQLGRAVSKSHRVHVILVSINLRRWGGGKRRGGKCVKE
jgi:hypothetical protein